MEPATRLRKSPVLAILAVVRHQALGYESPTSVWRAWGQPVAFSEQSLYL
jgi:hypothetical protein